MPLYVVPFYNTGWKKIASRFPTLNRDSLPIVKMHDTPFLTVHFVGTVGIIRRVLQILSISRVLRTNAEKNIKIKRNIYCLKIRFKYASIALPISLNVSLTLRVVSSISILLLHLIIQPASFYALLFCERRRKLPFLAMKSDGRRDIILFIVAK